MTDNTNGVDEPELTKDWNDWTEVGIALWSGREWARHIAQTDDQTRFMSSDDNVNSGNGRGEVADSGAARSAWCNYKKWMLGRDA